jgi:hypothetical protein
MNAKRCLTTALLVFAMPAMSRMAAAELQALRPNTELFVDDLGISAKSNVSRTIHPAEKLDHPVLIGKNGAPVRIYGTVLRDEDTGRFRMWYGRRYATSADGLHWEIPHFDFFPVDGQASNIVLPKGGGGVLFDPIDPDPAKRYKALLAEPIRVGGLSGYYSADGLHWKRYGDDRLVTAGSEIAMVLRDPKTRQYFAYIRPYPPKHFPVNNKQKRLGAVIRSDDFLHWSDLKVVLEPDAIDDAWVAEPDQRTEFYSMKGFAYGGSYLGIVPVFRIEKMIEKITPGQSRYDGPMHGQLITSRDGIDWSRMANRSPVLPGGRDSGTKFDVSIMDVASAPLVVDDELWLYYTAIDGTHGTPTPAKRITIALARWRLDGFVSLDAGAKQGTVETTNLPPLQHPAELLINARTKSDHSEKAPGFVCVEVEDENGHVLPGYGREDCAPLQGDSLRHRVRWKDHASLPAETVYRLRFVYRDASLFSYTRSRR